MTHHLGTKSKSPQTYAGHKQAFLRRMTASLLLAVMFSGVTGRAVETDWVYSTGSSSWFNTNNWSAGAPASGDDAFVANGTTAFVQGTSVATAANLSIDSGAVTIGDIDPGTLTVGGQISVGASGSSASLNLNYGTLSFNTLAVGTAGTYSDTTYGTLILTGDTPTIKMSSGVNVLIQSVITGTNGLNKAGLGTLTLLNDNTYSGGTTIEAGTLQVGNGGTTGSLGFGDVSNNATLIFNRSDTITVSNLISGSGNVIQNGGGTLIVTADNTYSGGTLISNGVVQVGDGGTTGSLGSGDIVNNTRLIFNRSDTVTVSNLISGAGTVTQTGSGTLIVTADNTYSGGTLITNGTIQVGDGGTTGSLGSGAIQNNGTLAFDRSDTVTVSNLVSGSGSLEQNGSGTLIVTANNTYTGTTTINDGTLQVGDGGTTGSLGTNDIYNFGTLSFNRTNNITVGNLISGTGAVEQNGAGVLTLTGTNTYSGGTIVNDGTLALANDQVLGSGDLTLTKGTLRSDYSLTSGLTINVGGNYTQGADGTLELWIGGVESTNFDQLKITGTATLDGTLHVAGFNDYVPYHNDVLKLITADGGVSGTFSSFTNDIVHSALLSPSLIYNADNVALTWEQLSFLQYLTASNQVSLTRNQTVMAQNLDLLANSTKADDIALINYLDYLPDLTNGLPAALNSLAPEELTALMAGSFAALDSQGSYFLSHARELEADYRKIYSDTLRGMAKSTNVFDAYVDRPWEIYFNLPVNFASVSGDANAAGYSLNSFGLSAGADRRLNNRLYVGGSIGVSTGGGDLENGGKIDSTGFNSEIHAIWFQDGVHLEAMLGGIVNSYDTKRQTIGGTANGNTSGFGWTGLLGGGYDWEFGMWKFGPQASIQYMSANVGGFTESGSLAPMKISAQNADAFHGQLGFNLRYHYYLPGTWTIITPEAYFGWRHDFMGDSLSLESQFANGSGDAFTVYGPGSGSDSILAGLGVSIQWKPALNTYLNFTVQSGRGGYSAENLNIGARLAF